MRNAGILACEKGRQWQLALSLLEQSARSGMRVSLITANSTLSACEKARRWEQALALFEAMRRQSFQPDPVTWTVAIGALAAGRLWQTALRSFWDLCHLRTASHTTLTTTLSACERALRWEELQGIAKWGGAKCSIDI